MIDYTMSEQYLKQFANCMNVILDNTTNKEKENVRINKDRRAKENNKVVK